MKEMGQGGFGRRRRAMYFITHASGEGDDSYGRNILAGALKNCVPTLLIKKLPKLRRKRDRNGYNSCLTFLLPETRRRADRS